MLTPDEMRFVKEADGSYLLKDKCSTLGEIWKPEGKNELVFRADWRFANELQSAKNLLKIVNFMKKLEEKE